MVGDFRVFGSIILLIWRILRFFRFILVRRKFLCSLIFLGMLKYTFISFVGFGVGVIASSGIGVRLKFIFRLFFLF